MFSPNIISTPASHQFQQGAFPQNLNLSQTMSPHQTSFDITCQFMFSPKHNGLYLYLCRILRPIWNRRCVDQICMDEKIIMVRKTYNYIFGQNNIYVVNANINVLECNVTCVDTMTKNST